MNQLENLNLYVFLEINLVAIWAGVPIVTQRNLTGTALAVVDKEVSVRPS